MPKVNKKDYREDTRNKENEKSRKLHYSLMRLFKYISGGKVKSRKQCRVNQ